MLLTCEANGFLSRTPSISVDTSAMATAPVGPISAMASTIARKQPEISIGRLPKIGNASLATASVKSSANSPSLFHCAAVERDAATARAQAPARASADSMIARARPTEAVIDAAFEISIPQTRRAAPRRPALVSDRLSRQLLL